MKIADDGQARPAWFGKVAEVTRAAGMLRAANTPTRLGILLLLDECPRTVFAIADALGREHSAVSRHLTALRRADLVTFRPSGTRHVYGLTEAGRALARTIRMFGL